MRLMTTQAAHLHLDLAVVQRVVNIGYRVPDHRMSQASLEREMNHLGEIILRQFHLPVKDQCQVILRIHGRLGVRTMALEAESVAFCAQQLRMFTSMRIVTGGASLLEGGLMQYLLAVQLSLIGVTLQAHIDCIRFEEPGCSAGMGTVTVCAVSCCPRMLDRRSRNFLCLIRVAGDAQFLDLSLHQHNSAVLGSDVARLALLLDEGIVHEFLQQLGTIGLVRIVALQAIGLFERLAAVRFDQPRVLHIVAVETERRGRLG